MQYCKNTKNYKTIKQTTLRCQRIPPRHSVWPGQQTRYSEQAFQEFNHFRLQVIVVILNQIEKKTCWNGFWNSQELQKAGDEEWWESLRMHYSRLLSTCWTETTAGHRRGDSGLRVMSCGWHQNAQPAAQFMRVFHPHVT